MQPRSRLLESGQRLLLGSARIAGGWQDLRAGQVDLPASLRAARRMSLTSGTHIVVGPHSGPCVSSRGRFRVLRFLEGDGLRRRGGQESSGAMQRDLHQKPRRQGEIGSGEEASKAAVSSMFWDGLRTTAAAAVAEGEARIRSPRGARPRSDSAEGELRSCTRETREVVVAPRVARPEVAQEAPFGVKASASR